MHTSSNKMPAKLVKLQTLKTLPPSFVGLSETAQKTQNLKADRGKSSFSFFSKFRKEEAKADKKSVARSSAKSSMSFDVSAWVMLSEQLKQNFSLWLKFSDDKGEHIVLVDECYADNCLGMMMSGAISFEYVGSLSNLSLCCTQIPEIIDCHLEDVSVKRTDQSFKQKDDLEVAMM